MPVLTVIEGVLCEQGPVSVLITNAESDVVYQLFDVATGMPTGDTQQGGNNLLLVSDDVTEETMLEVRAYRGSFALCGIVTSPFTVDVYSLEITASTNTLIATLEPVAQDAVTYQWYRNGEIILNGGISNAITVYDDATYTVEVVTSEGCILETATSKIGNADMNNDEIISSLVVFPNPSTDNITCTYINDSQENVRLVIYSTDGSIVYDVQITKEFEEMVHQLNISNLASGIYQLHLVGSENVEIQKFIKL